MKRGAGTGISGRIEDRFATNGGFGRAKGKPMADNKKDPTAPIRHKASRYPGVVEGTACTQSSFKIGKKAFLYIGMQGGRYKAMFKLQRSIPEVTKLAETDPACYGVGKFGWVTARFSADNPIPKTLWEKWLDESYEQIAVTKTGKKPLRSSNFLAVGCTKRNFSTDHSRHAVRHCGLES